MKRHGKSFLQADVCPPLVLYGKLYVFIYLIKKSKKLGFENFTKQQLEALNDQYLPRRTVENVERYLDGARDRSAAVRDQLTCQLDVAYGDSALQSMDIFPGESPGSPVFVFIHGGYWWSGDKQLYSEIAVPFVEAGATVIIPNYDLCPNVTIPDIVAQIQNCLKWVYFNVGDFNGDPDGLYVGGHSAGGHLTAMMMTTDWNDRFSIPNDLLKGAIPISGLFDIEPHRHTDLQANIRLTAEDAAANSPQNLELKSRCPVICAVGGGESEEFLRQSREFTQKCQSAGLACTYLALGEDNHFDITERLHKKEDPLTRAILDQMGL